MSNISCLKFVGLYPFAAVPRKFKCTYTSIIIRRYDLLYLPPPFSYLHYPPTHLVFTTTLVPMVILVLDTNKSTNDSVPSVQGRAFTVGPSTSHPRPLELQNSWKSWH